MIGTEYFSTISRFGKTSVARNPRSRRPGFLGIPVFWRVGSDGIVVVIGSPVYLLQPGGTRRSVVVGAGQEVAASTDEFALALIHLGAAVGARQHHETRIGLG